MAADTLTIGFVSSAFSPIPGGREAYLDHLSRALVKQGHRVTVATRFIEECPQPFRRLLSSHEPAQTYDREGVRVSVVAPRNGRSLLLRAAARFHYYPRTEGLAIQLYHAAFQAPLREALADCDVVHYSGTGRELIGFVAQRFAAENNKPFFITPHMHVGSWGDSALDFRLYQSADGLVALTEYERDAYVEQGLEKSRISVQGHGINVAGTGHAERVRTELGIGSAPMILFLGRKTEYKGYPTLLQAAPSVWARHPNAHIVLAGPPDDMLSLGRVEQTVAADPRVHELGFVSDEVREDLYAACDIFCLPSEAEAFGLVYLEAGAYGKPVVALDLPPLRELIARSQTGLLTSSSPSQVAAALSRLLDDDEYRSQLGQNGWRTARPQTWARVAGQMVERYRAARVDSWDDRIRFPSLHPG